MELGFGGQFPPGLAGGKTVVLARSSRAAQLEMTVQGGADLRLLRDRRVLGCRLHPTLLVPHLFCVSATGSHYTNNEIST